MPGRNLWCDIDYNGRPPDEALGKLSAFPLPPSVTVRTGGGFHAYWILREPASSEETPSVESYLKRLAHQLEGDPISAEAARILRIPGTWSHKRKCQVTIEVYNPTSEFDLSDFDFLPPLPHHEIRNAPGWEAELLEGIEEGKRNDAIARLTGRYLAKGLSRHEILPILLDANGRFKPPLETKEVTACLDSVIKTHQRNHPKHETYDDGALCHEPDEANGIVLPTLADICDMDVKVEWVIENLIPKDAVTVLHGRGGVGKTWLMLQCGSSVAEGTTFVGLSTKKMPCYYIDFENSLAVLHDRGLILGRSSLMVWHNSNPIPPPRLDSKDWEVYKELERPSLIIVDSLRASQGLDENSSKDMSLIMGRLKVLRDMGFTIVLIHHTPKGNEKVYKGSTAIADQCDHVLGFDKVKSIGDEGVIDDDDDDQDYPLRLGVRGKTRYEPFRIYLEFDPTSGFDLAPDPDEAILKQIYDLLNEFKIREGKRPNQSELITIAKELVGTKRGCNRLLKKGEGRFWLSKQYPDMRNAILYEPINPQ